MPPSWHGRFDPTDLPRSRELAEPDEAISRFREAVRGRLSGYLDVWSLIQPQRAIFAMAAAEWRPEATNAAPASKEGRHDHARQLPRSDALRNGTGSTVTELDRTSH